MLFVYKTHPLFILRPVKGLSEREKKAIVVDLFRGDSAAQNAAAEVFVALDMAVLDCHHCPCGSCDPERRLTFK